MTLAALGSNRTRGGLWSLILMRLVTEERRADPVLTAGEQLILDANKRKGRLPGGSVRLVQPMLRV